MTKLTPFFTFCIVLLMSTTNASFDLANNHMEKASFNKEYTYDITCKHSITMIYNNPHQDALKPPRLLVKLCSQITHSSVIVFVRHSGGPITWQLSPVTCDDSLEAARTLWTPINNTNGIAMNMSQIIVNFSTESHTPITLTANMTRVLDFSFSLRSFGFDVALLQPVIYHFKFDKVDMVLIKVMSEDCTCMTFSIQNSTNSVFDTIETVKYQGLRQTVSKNGGIIASKEEYPFGLLLVFVVHSSDELCNETNEIPTGTDLDLKSAGEVPIRKKRVTLIIKSTINLNLKIMSFVVIVILLLWALIFSVLFYNKKSNVVNKPHGANQQQSAANRRPTFESSSVIIENDFDNHSSHLEDFGIMNARESGINKKLPKEFKRISTMFFINEASTQNPERINSQSKLYLWNLITVAIFYSLPVIQLVFSFQKILNDYGNQDLCYYNFFCSHGLIILNFKFSDFNHIFSNIGYVFFGLLFIIITYKRESIHVPKKNFGTPHHSGLYYAMGAALAIEGLMSACYHVCPNHSNFQFDTSFMYIICMLCIVKIYQTRHPDIHTSAYFVFGVLACVIILGFGGIKANNGLAFNVFFAFIHLSTCFWLTTYIYYSGKWKLDKKLFQQYYEHVMSSPYPYIPKYKDRLILLIIGLSINFGLAACNIFQPKMFGDFSNYLLTLFMVNLILYLSFYIVMKLISKERINLGSFVYIILAKIFWGAALYFFNNRTSSWDMSPAQSREINTRCVLFELFDNHDIWHFLSAISLFFSFMVLLTLDDDLVERPTDTIPIF